MEGKIPKACNFSKTLGHRSGEHIHKNKTKKKQLQKSPREAFAAFSGKDIAASVSKQNNKTSQPVVVNFLFASIDSISFSPSETAAAALHRWKQGNKTGGNRGSEKRWRWSASGRKAIEDLTSTKKKTNNKKNGNLDEVNLNCCGRFYSPISLAICSCSEDVN